MPTQFSKKEIIEKNKSAIEVCNQSIDRLNSIVGLPNELEIQRIAQLSRATNEKTFLRQVNAHLRAAGTTVRPMSNETAASLNSLANRLDHKIQNNLIINASIEFVTEVLDEAAELRTITTSHAA